jgi:hypothetical protein
MAQKFLNGIVSEGSITTDSKVIAGSGDGSVALTVNDGGGNANLTFNHADETPDKSGNSFRIRANVDSSSSPAMLFEMASGVTAGTSVSTSERFRIDNSGAKVRVSGGGIMDLQRDDTSVVANNTLGKLRFMADDPTNGSFNVGAEIYAKAEAAWDTDSYPTRLEFYTTTTDTSILALTIDKDQNATFTGQVIFPSADTTKPVLPNGFISRNDLDDTSGRHDIWGISERYYPSNSTAGDAWGIQWSGTPNDICFVGGGSDRFTVSLNDGNITGAGTATFAGTIGASNLSGTNTGDQTLPTDFVSASSGGTFSGSINITEGAVNGTSFASNRLLRLQNTSTTDGSRMGITFQGNSSVGSGLAWIEGVSDDQSAGHTSIRMSTYNGSWHTDAFILGADGNATFSGSLDVNGTGNNTFTGNILIDNAAPIIQTNSSNNASGLRINVTGISDSTNNLFRVQRSGTTVFDIRGNSNAIFEGTVTATHFYGDGSNLTSVDADKLDTYQLAGSTSISTVIFNNKGQIHDTNQNFNTVMTPGFNYMRKGTNGPTNTEGHQWYGVMSGLGSDYGTSTGTSNHYANQLYWNRISQGNNAYLWSRDMEGGTWASWRKMSAGDSDTLGGNLPSAFALSSVVNQTDFVSKASGGTFEDSIIIKETNATSNTTGTTMLTLHNANTADISQQQSWIDFKFTDTNANYAPQVRIGAQVGPDADADSIQREGSGSFVVYTAPVGSDTAGNSTGLAEQFRVSYNGDSTFQGAVTGTSFSATGGFLNGSNGGLRIHSGGTKFFNVTAANVARDNIMDVGASDARFKDAYFGGTVSANTFTGDGSNLTGVTVSNADTVDNLHASAFLQAGGSWNGANMPGSRYVGLAVNGGEVVFQRDNPNNAQMSILVDGAFYAGENNGFYSLYSSNSYNSKAGFYADSSGVLQFNAAATFTGNVTCGQIDATSFTDVITNTIMTASGDLDIKTVLTGRDIRFRSGSNAMQLRVKGDATGILINDHAGLRGVSATSATATTIVAEVPHALFNAAFFDFVIKNGTNVRAGTVYACHNGASTPLVEFAETSTVDLGDTSDVTLSVVISGNNMNLQAVTTSNTWTIKSLVRTI